MAPLPPEATEVAAVADSCSSQTSRGQPRLPVTLLSGFLGSGKTTLLQHVLKNKEHGLRVAVIVNDMGEVNVDADLVAKSGILQRKEQLVRLENGCICCTLRLDLLEEVANIARNGEVDYIIIESSGISEPMQVAETFAFELPSSGLEKKGHPSGSSPEPEREMMEEEEEEEEETTDGQVAGRPSKRSRSQTPPKSTEIGMTGEQDPSSSSSSVKEHVRAMPQLKDIAILDTCVTVVDAANFSSVFEDTRLLCQLDAHKDELPKDDTRTLTDLLCDQIEFADVIVLNKTDLVSPQEVERVERVIKRFNPYATLVKSVQGRIDPKNILGTKKFSFERAASHNGWLESLSLSRVVPETEEYGVGAFIYSARKPFHPQRLMNLLQKELVIIEAPDLPPPPMDEEHMDEEQEEADERAEENGEEEIDDPMAEDEAEDSDGEDPLDQDVVRRRLVEKRKGIFKNLLRSKGVFWLATRPKNYGMWSQAGLYCTLSNGGMWMIDFPEERRTRSMKELPNYEELMAREDGDKRQELVFIGKFSADDGDIAKIRSGLDSCLLREDEMVHYRGEDFEEWEDPFEEWSYYEFSEEDDSEGKQCHRH